MAIYEFDEIEIKADPPGYEEDQRKKYEVIEQEMEKLYTPTQMANVIDGVSIYSNEGIEKAKTEAIINAIESAPVKKGITKKMWWGIGAAALILYLAGRK